MNIKIIKKTITKNEIRELAKQTFGDMMKAVVDVDKKIMAIGGDLHADEEAVLLEVGSKQKDLWGINIYPDVPDDEWIEFDSLINIRPSQNNRTRSIEDRKIQEKIKEIVNYLVKK